MTHFEIVMKLIGEVRPIGETITDNQRYENLKVLCELADRIVGEIGRVARDRDGNESSVKQAGKYAHNFLSELKEALE